MIVLGIIVILILYIIYTYVYMSSTIVGDAVDIDIAASSKRTDVPASLMTTPNSKEYYYSMWIYVDNNYPYDVDNTIINRGSYWHLVLKGSKLSLYAGGTTDASGTYSKNAASVGDQRNGNEILVFTDNFPFQKWVFVVFSVSGNTIDGYIDGKLVKTVSGSSSSLGTDATTAITRGNKNIIGKLNKINYYPTAIDPQTVWNNYIQSSGVFGWAKYFQKYKVEMDISKNNEQYYKLPLL